MTKQFRGEKTIKSSIDCLRSQASATPLLADTFLRCRVFRGKFNTLHEYCSVHRYKRTLHLGYLNLKAIRIAWTVCLDLGICGMGALDETIFQIDHRFSRQAHILTSHFIMQSGCHKKRDQFELGCITICNRSSADTLLPYI